MSASSFTRVCDQSVLQALCKGALKQFISTSALEKCSIRISNRTAPQECPTRVSLTRCDEITSMMSLCHAVWGGCGRRQSSREGASASVDAVALGGLRPKSILQECCAKVSQKNVMEGCVKQCLHTSVAVNTIAAALLHGGRRRPIDQVYRYETL